MLQPEVTWPAQTTLLASLPLQGEPCSNEMNFLFCIEADINLSQLGPSHGTWNTKLSKDATTFHELALGHFIA